MNNLTDNFVFTTLIMGLLSHRPMTTAELYAHAQSISPVRCDDSVLDKWGAVWKHHLRSAQQDLRRIGAIDYNSNGLWSLTQ